MPRHVFAPVLTAVVLVAVGGYMALRLGLAADRFLPQLSSSRPILSTVTPSLGEAPPKRVTRRVVLVIIDGLRLRESFGLRYLDSLRRLGIDASATSHYPTFSRPNYVSIVTGVPPRWSGVRTNHFDLPLALDSIMDRLGEAGMESSYVGNYSDGIPVMFTHAYFSFNGSPFPVVEFESDLDESRYVRWPGGFVGATRQLIARRQELVILLPGQVDEAGHEHGADSEEYRAAARHVDRLLRAGLHALDLTRDTIIVVADHGHTDSGGHGGTEPEVMTVPLVMAGAGIRPGAAIDGARLIDVAPTIAALLGVPPPQHGLGRTLTEGLILAPELKTRVGRSDAQRVMRNRMLIAVRRAAAVTKVRQRRVLRFSMVFAMLALGVALLFLAWKLHALRFDWRVLLIAVPAFPVSYYALLGVLGQSYSPSIFPERGDAVAALLEFGVASTGVQVVAGWFALRGRVNLRDRLAAANAITGLGLVGSLVPAGVMWAYHCGPFVEVPSESAVVLVPATFIAVACFAVAATMTLGLEIIVFFARAVDPRVRLRRLERAAQRERERLASESDDT